MVSRGGIFEAEPLHGQQAFPEKRPPRRSGGADLYSGVEKRQCGSLPDLCLQSGCAAVV